MTSFADKAGTQINYYLFAPRAAEGGRRLPLVLWLHGGVKANGVGGPEIVQDAFYKDQQQKDHPCYVLRPVAVRGENWVSPRGPGTASHKMPEQPSKSIAAVVELLDKIVAEKGIDTDRLYVFGASMGGYGTWDLIQRYPGKFAAAMPICGGGDPSKADSLKHTAIWVTHGENDRIVPPRGSREMFDALMKARGQEPVVKDDARALRKASPDDRLRYYEYKGGNHNSAWDNGLTEADLVEWFFSKRAKESP